MAIQTMTAAGRYKWGVEERLHTWLDWRTLLK